MTEPDPYDEPVEWRRLSPRLWVGRRDGAPIGMIERGRRYTATDANEQPRGSFRTLAQAQDALAAPGRGPRTERVSAGEPGGRLMLVGAGTVGLLTASLATVGLATLV